jgi:heptosyltransferase-3
MGSGPAIERHLKRAVFGALAATRSRTGTLPELRDVHRILLVRPNFRLGNLVLTTPALEVLDRAFPLARVDVLCGAAYADLFGCDPAVRATIGVTRDLHRHPVELMRLVRRLRAARYDLVIDAARGSSFLGAFFARACGGRLRVASETARYPAMFNVFVPNDTSSPHKIDLLLGLLRGLGLAVDDVAPRIVLGEDDHRRASELWRSLGLDRHPRTIGVAPGGRGLKQWPLDRVIDIVRGLHAFDRAGVVLFPGPEDRARLAAISSALPSDLAVAPVLPIRTFAALLARCDVVVTADSGPMHLASAVRTPTVTLLRSEASEYYLPRGARDRALPWLEPFSVDVVLDAVAPIVAATSPRRAASAASSSTEARRDENTPPRGRSADPRPA